MKGFMKLLAWTIAYDKAPSNKLLWKTRPTAFGMSDPICGPLIQNFVDDKKNWEG